MRFFQSIVVVLFIAFSAATLNGQTEHKKNDLPAPPPAASHWVEGGRFHSVPGKFSIAIPALPQQTIDQATEKAKAKGVDVGKAFIWRFDRTFYTLYYDPPVDKDGNPYPHVYADMVTGSRKGALNGGATMISEKPTEFGKHRATELRYSLPNGVQFISRIILVGDRGYQVVGAYRDSAGETEVLKVLDSFTPSEK